MMALDQLSLLKRDPGKVGVSLDLFADQLLDGWRQAKVVRLPSRYRKIERVAVCGMGGSHLGADVLRSACSAGIPVPITILPDYHLPAWVDHKTLVIASSYSGSTEETLAAFRLAAKRRAKIVAITSGGKLAQIGKQYPRWKFTPAANPSGQPRLGIGYNLMALMGVGWRLGWFPNPNTDINAWAATARKASLQYGFKRNTAGNQAKQLANQLSNKIPLLIGAEWTAGNLHTWHNQINENAKTVASWFLLPDLNHHLLEGLRNRNFTRQMHAVMITDRSYHPRTRKRFTLTKKIIHRQGATVSSFSPHGKTTIEKSIDLLSFGGYVSWYLSALRGVDPAPIPTVDFLKQQLGKR